MLHYASFLGRHTGHYMGLEAIFGSFFPPVRRIMSYMICSYSKSRDVLFVKMLCTYNIVVRLGNELVYNVLGII